MKFKFIFVLLMAFSCYSFGQKTPVVPQEPVLSTPEDYAKYHPLIIEIADWMENTPIDKQAEKSEEIESFFLKWVSGSPRIVMAINDKHDKFLFINQALLTVFMTAYCREILQHGKTANSFYATKAGIKAAVKVYKKGIEMKNDPEMDRISKMSDGEIDLYITDTMGIKNLSE